MRKEIFKGAATALITPFTQTGVDWDSFEKLINIQIEAGINALVICGTTGEASTMPDDEHLEVIRFAVEKAAGRVPIIGGTGSNDTRHGIKLSQGAEAFGADALLLVTPYYNKTSQEGLYQHFKALADSVNIPIVLYNVPTRSSVNISPETTAQLAQIDNIVAVKECNLAQLADVRRLTPEDFSIYSGNDDQILYNLAMGGSGVISVLSNIMPAYTTRMTSKYFSGDIEGSRKMQLDAMPLINALFCDVNPIPVKAAMALMGYCNGLLRMPLINMAADKLSVLKNEMAKFNLI